MRFFILIAVLWANVAQAQTFPDYVNTTVNDYADLLDPSAEAALSAQLDQLRRDTGVEMTVLTLPSQSDFAPDQSLESFATALFNRWGIGDADRNDGVLVMILRQDRAMRIELGAAYAHDWDRTAKAVVDDHFVGAFADDDYPRGIKDGSTAVIDKIVTPFLAGEAPASDSKDNKFEFWVFGAFLAFIAATSGRQQIGDSLARFRVCPRCNQRGLRQSRKTHHNASTTESGWGLKRIRCTHCDYDEDIRFTIPRRSKGSSGFGGGRSGGGGASGRW